MISLHRVLLPEYINCSDWSNWPAPPDLGLVSRVRVRVCVCVCVCVDDESYDLYHSSSKHVRRRGEGGR